MSYHIIFLYNCCQPLGMWHCSCICQCLVSEIFYKEKTICRFHLNTSSTDILDGMKQKQMSHRLKERDKLAQTINTYKLLFKTTRQLIKEMNGKNTLIKVLR